MTGLAFHPEADRELIEAAQFYEARRTGLGDQFLERITDIPRPN